MKELKVAAAISFLALTTMPALATNTNVGTEAGCQYHVVCVINGRIVTGDAQKACNGGKVETIKQCNRKTH